MVLFVRRGAAVLLLSWLPASSVFGQDLAVTPQAWIYEEENPETLPVRGTPKIAEVPEKVENLTRPTFARVRELVGEDGARVSHVINTELPWLKSPARDIYLSNPSKAPARRGGKPVACEVEYFLVFNPAAASKRGDREMPRLVQPATIALPTEGSKAQELFAEFEFSIDAEGRAVDLKPVDASVTPALVRRARASLPRWGFEPARRDGKSVAAAVVVPVLFLAEPPFDGAAADVKAEAILQRLPRYPLAARQEGVPGRVVISFVVDIEGRPRDLRVMESSNEIFEAPALQAIREWRFRPGRAGGVAVPLRYQQEIRFQLEGGDSPGLLTVRKDPKKLKKLPPDMQWDAAPVYSRIQTATYPFDALVAGKEGTATLAFVVGPKGSVVESRVVEASDPQFGGAAAAMIETHTFEPAARDGKPCHALLSLKVEFSRRGNALVQMDAQTLKIAQRLAHERGSFALPKDLDEPLTPRSRKPPKFPLNARNHQGGEAVVEFVVDSSGIVRAPRVLSASASEFGFAAAQAVANWRFAPASKDGVPVEVIVRQPLRFGATP